MQAEGKYAIDSPGSPTAPEIPPEEYSLREYNYLQRFETSNCNNTAQNSYQML